MKRRDFDINILKLNEGVHEFEYQLNDKFFEGFESSPIEKGNLEAKVVLTKSSGQIKADFFIKGSVEVTCDRSLENFDYNVDTHDFLIFKFGDRFEEISEEIVIIPADTQQLNVAQYLYEFTGLSIPMKKLHPRFQDEEDDENEETLFIYSTGGADTSYDEDEEEESELAKKLKGIKFNNN